MSEKKYVVPEGMRRAAGQATHNVDPEGYIMLPGLEAAIRWLAENPIWPTPEQALAMSVTKPVIDSFDNWELVRWGACEWQRRMFLASEPKIPEAVKDLVVDLGISPELSISRKQFNRDILEAYRRGTLSHTEK